MVFLVYPNRHAEGGGAGVLGRARDGRNRRGAED
jgi:hypothetical protein